MNHYLQNRVLYPPLIHKKVSLNLGIVVVIPCYDEDYLLLSLMSLKKCDAPKCDVEVIVVINHPEDANKAVKEQNQKTFEQANQWASQNSTPYFKFYILWKADLGKKNAGVGLARKIGMDEACWRFEKIKKPRGIIVGFDADSRCETNYFTAIEAHFQKHPKTQACSIYFEHPLQGIDFEEKTYKAIVLYELHLRYFIQAQRWAGFPHAIQTIGSSMAVRCNAYQQQGGMNRRKAGEDFYFLHKFTVLGKHRNLITTTVYPSSRPSHRVPFGTGKAVDEITKNEQTYLTYAPQSFIDLRLFFKTIPTLFSQQKTDLPKYLEPLPKSIQAFLTAHNFQEKVIEIQRNTTNKRTFSNRFFRWFNAFFVIKFLHFARDNFYPNVPIEEGANWLVAEVSTKNTKEQNEKTLLEILRNRDKSAS